MTRDSNRKKAVRAYAKAHGLKYCEAQRQLAGTSEAPQLSTYKVYAPSAVKAHLMPEHKRQMLEIFEHEPNSIGLFYDQNGAPIGAWHRQEIGNGEETWAGTTLSQQRYSWVPQNPTNPLQWIYGQGADDNLHCLVQEITSKGLVNMNDEKDDAGLPGAPRTAQQVASIMNTAGPGRFFLLQTISDVAIVGRDKEGCWRGSGDGPEIYWYPDMYPQTDPREIQELHRTGDYDDPFYDAGLPDTEQEAVEHRWPAELASTRSSRLVGAVRTWKTRPVTSGGCEEAVEKLSNKPAEEKHSMNRNEWLEKADQHLNPLHFYVFSTDEFWHDGRQDENPVIQLSIRNEWWRERPLKQKVIDQVFPLIPESTADIVQTLRGMREDDVINAEDEGVTLEQYVGVAVPDLDAMTDEEVITWWKTLGKGVYNYTDFDTTPGLQTDWDVREKIVIPAIQGSFHGTHGTSMELNLDYRNINPDTILELFKENFPGLEAFIDTMLT